VFKKAIFFFPFFSVGHSQRRRRRRRRRTMADPSATLPLLTQAEHEEIENTRRTLQGIDGEQELHWAPFSDGGVNGDDGYHARYRKNDDGSWTAIVYTHEGKIVSREKHWELTQEETQMAEVVVPPLGPKTALTFFPGGVPEKKEWMRAGFARATATILFERLRPADTKPDSRSLYNFFTMLAHNSGHEATKIFVEKVGDLIQKRARYSGVEIDAYADDEDEYDGKHLWHPEDPVDPRGFQLFQYATSTALQAVRRAEFSGMDFKTAIVFHAAPSYHHPTFLDFSGKRAADDFEAADTGAAEPDAKKVRLD
jgi:hypothetical protein